VRLHNALGIIASAALLVAGCTEDAARVCSNDKQCRDKAAAGSIDKSWTKCYPEGYCAAPCTTDDDCKGPPWKDGLVCDKASGICVDGTPRDAMPDKPQQDAGPDGDATVPDGTPDLPPDLPPPDIKKTNGATCGGNNECISNQCVDGVCCDTASCGPCESCKTGKGICAADDADGNAKNDCDGQDAACNGTCSGGKCDYSATNATVCGAVNCNATTLTSIDEVRCKDGACNDTQTRACTPTFTLCDTTATPDACRPGCKTHADCDDAGAGKALCDRTSAHDDPNGLGTCVDPAQVTVITTNAQLMSYLATPGGKWGKVKPLAAGAKYPGNYTIDKVVRLVADGAVSIRPGSGGPAFKVESGGGLTVQGVEILDAFDTSATSDDGDGILCVVTGAKPPLVVVESTISGANHVGISVTNCSLTLRRSTINQNGGGGLNLSTGTFIITNTLITGNGVANSTFGGVALASASGTSLFEHNTVIDNYVNSTQPAGVTCAFGPVSVRASIITGNENSQTSGCTLDSLTNTTDCGATQTNSYKPSLAACLDTAATTTLTLDRASGPRVKGSGPDLGCYEVQ
jgi:hypothetical protein